ncbi:MAG: hypothetical protein M9887_08875 [Chitinophagales bacterium]|nr:hypothetical protein [Chitinophagales bacterium]
MTTQLIYELLLENDYVVLPGFGGFICQYNSAKLEKVQSRILPPSRTIAFNKALQKNDGLLIQFVMLKDNCSYKEAEAKVSRFVTQVKDDLQKNGSYQFPKIGRVYIDKQTSNTLFVAHHEFLPLDESFGLTELTLQPVIRKGEETATGKTIQIPGTKVKVSGYQWPYWVAASVAMIFLVGTFWLNLKNSNIDNVITANLLPDYSIHYVDTQSAQSFVEIDNSSIKSEFISAYNDIKSHAVKDEVIEEEVTAVPAKNIYAIVVGAFRGPITAGKYVENLKEQGYDAETLKGTSPSKLIKVLVNYPADNAEDALAHIRTTVEEDAWLLD